MSEGYSCQGILTKMSTTVDGGWRITVDIPQSESRQIFDLAKLRDTVIQLAMVPITDKSYGVDPGVSDG